MGSLRKTSEQLSQHDLHAWPCILRSRSAICLFAFASAWQAASQKHSRRRVDEVRMQMC